MSYIYKLLLGNLTYSQTIFRSKIIWLKQTHILVGDSKIWFQWNKESRRLYFISVGEYRRCEAFCEENDLIQTIENHLPIFLRDNKL